MALSSTIVLNMRRILHFKPVGLMSIGKDTFVQSGNVLGLSQNNHSLCSFQKRLIRSRSILKTPMKLMFCDEQCRRCFSLHRSNNMTVLNNRLTSTKSRSRFSMIYNYIMHQKSQYSVTTRAKSLFRKRERNSRDSNLDRKRDLDALKAYGSESLLDRFLFVKTLDGFYDDVPTGIVMDTAYAESIPNKHSDKITPVIVGLHDTPGNHKDLVPLLEFFAKLGCRTVSPTFPGHGETRGVMRGHDDIFCQSTLERANFVNDFVQNLDIDRVDILIGVGAASYTTMALCSIAPTVYRSMALISPWPISKAKFDVNSQRLKRFQELWDAPFLRPFLRLPLSNVNVGNARTAQEKVTLGYLLSRADFGEIQSHTIILSERKFPHIIAFGGCDEEMDQSLYDELFESLEVKSNSITTFDGVLRNINVPGALRFPNSGYDIIHGQRGILCAYVLKLLQTMYPHIKV